MLSGYIIFFCRFFDSQCVVDYTAMVCVFIFLGINDRDGRIIDRIRDNRRLYGVSVLIGSSRGTGG